MKNKIVLLTCAELKILFLIGEGIKNNRIAEQLFNSINTIRTHIRNLYHKLEIPGNNKIPINTDRIKLQNFANKNMKIIKSQLNKNHNNSYIYFILDEFNNAVKIGWTTNPQSRLKSLRAENLNKLKLIFVENGERNREFALHKKFTKYRIRNEWFKYSDKIKDYIKHHKKD